MKGWVKIHREILHSDIWHDVNTFRLFTYLIINATHKDGTKINGIELKEGQYIRSYRKIAEDLAYKEGRGLKKPSTKTIKKCVEKLVNAERVSKEETEWGTLFTVLNYALYQGKTDMEDQTVNGTGNEGETKGKRRGNKNKNGKNGKNGNYISSSSDPLFSEVMEFYQNNLQKGVTDSPFNYELLTVWYEEYGYDLILSAMKVSAKAEAKGVKFLEGVLTNWKEAGVKTIEDARRYEEQFKQYKTKRNYTRRGNRQDIVPDWYRKEKEKQKKAPEKVETDQEKQKVAQEADQLLKQYLSNNS